MGMSHRNSEWHALGRNSMTNVRSDENASGAESLFKETVKEKI